eukprot:763759-Hanusia_phi.AAC.2
MPLLSGYFTVKIGGEEEDGGNPGEGEIEIQEDRAAGSAGRNKKAAVTARKQDRVLNVQAGREAKSRYEHG